MVRDGGNLALRRRPPVQDHSPAFRPRRTHRGMIVTPALRPLVPHAPVLEHLQPTDVDKQTVSAGPGSRGSPNSPVSLPKAWPPRRSQAPGRDLFGPLV
jgi:hypothetical protein